ncbi:MAG: Gfo/Idh/MocA family oxidoreductase [Dehalococcoidia bacterium]|nr:Gfo/Idh/MocA family oxidoreductase [Dehalococcoidia bacterium]
MTLLRVAVVGAGYWGPNLIRNFHKLGNCQLVAVADLDPKALNGIKRSYGSVETTTDAGSLLTRPDIDAVAIATPPHTHYQLARKALENGKHVLIEKPLTDSTADAEELVKLAEKTKRTLMVDHTFVYSGPVRKIRGMVDSNELGEIWYLDSVRIDLGLFTNDTNVVWDLAPHDLSIMGYLLDARPVEVSATGASPVKYFDGKVESIAYITVRLDNGCITHFHLSWLSPVKIRRILIGGSKKMLVYDHLDPDHQVVIYDKGVDITSEEERRRFLVQRRTGDMYAPKIDQTEPLETMCKHFVECALTGKRPITDGVSGLNVVRLIEATMESMRLGGAVVAL